MDTSGLANPTELFQFLDSYDLLLEKPHTHDNVMTSSCICGGVTSAHQMATGRTSAIPRCSPCHSDSDYVAPYETSQEAWDRLLNHNDTTTKAVGWATTEV
jgi:cytochrome c5